MDFTAIRDDEHDEAAEESANRPGCALRLARVLLVAALLFALVAGVIPMLLSSDPGRAWALRKINAKIAPSEVAVEQWSLGWFSAPVLDGVRYTDAVKGVAAKAEQVVFDRGLLRLLPVGTLSLGRVTVKKPDIAATLATGAPPPPVVAGTGAGAGRKSSGFVLPVVGMSGTLALEDGRLTVSGRDAHAFSAQQLNAEVTVPSWRKPVEVNVQAQVGNGTAALGGRLASLASLTSKQEVGAPETLTLTLARVNLAAFTPLMRQFSESVWFDSGEADGTLAFAIAGADHFSLNGDMRVNGLSVASGQGAPSPKTDVALRTDIACAEGKADITRFDLTSPWVRASAKGALQFGAKDKRMTGAVNATADADLATLVRDFGTMLGFSPEFTMQTGSAHLGFSLDAQETAVGIEAGLVTRGLQMRFANEPLVLKPEPQFLLKMVLPHDGRMPSGEMKLDAPFAEVSASGSLDSAQMKGFLNLTAFSRDFRRVFKSLPPMVGEITLDASTQTASIGQTADILLTAKDLAAEVKPGARMVIPHGTLKASAVTGADGNAPFAFLKMATFDLSVEGGSASGKCDHFALVKNDDAPAVPLLRGFSMKSDFELGSLRRLIGAFLPEGLRQQTAGWRGQFVLNATAETADGTTKALFNAAGMNISGTAGTNTVVTIPDVRLSGSIAQERADGDIRADTELSGSMACLRDERTVFAEKDARLKTDLLIAPDFSRVRAKSFSLTSGLLSAQGSLDVTELQSRCMVAAQGKMTVDCESVTHLLDAHGIDEWTLAGRAARDFKFKGPVAGGINTLFAEGEVDAAVFIASLKGMGLDAGSSDLSVKLARGVMNVSYAPPLNGGKLRCVPVLTLERGNLTCLIPPKTRLLENVRVSQEAMDYLLVNIFPVFRGSIAQDGTATLDVAAFKYVHGITPDKGLVADTTLLLRNPRLMLGPAMRELLTLLKIKNYSWRTDQLSVRTVIKDGRIHIAPVRVEVEKQPMTFSGWVTFNGAINYLIEVPLTERLIGREASRAVSGRSVKLPVTGTVHAPRIDTAALTRALADTVTETIQEEVIDRANEFLDKLMKELQR
ncbi:MAG: hypothetical protein FWG50_07195 [Kiritimatiellaeota bacterium]|nr:hypothetical protein [Kiritimatiellota bacterium]